MKRILTLILALVASVSMLFAQSGTCGEGLTWNITDSVLTVSGEGPMVDVYMYGAQWEAYLSSIKTAIFEEGVTRIAMGAFRYSKTLTSITIPSTMKDIGDGAFYACDSLKNYYISSITDWLNLNFEGGGRHANLLKFNNSLYLNGELITDLVIPDGVTSIPNFAFYYCTSLTSVTIPASVDTIGTGAFTGCKSLTSPIYTAKEFIFMPRTYSGAYTIPYGIKQIAGGAFLECDSLTAITIPNSVTHIGDNAFRNCNRLTSVTLPDSVISLGDFAFFSCDSLRSIHIGTGITRLPAYVFGSAAIDSITIPEGVTEIGKGVFNYCRRLKSITIPESVTTIGDVAFEICSSLSSIVIPNSVTSIGKRAFYSCEGLTSVVVGNNVESIGEDCFADNSALVSITLGERLKNIEQAAFQYCTSLPSIVIPDSVTSINKYMFRGCNKLKTVTIGKSVANIAQNAFDECDGFYEIHWNARNCNAFNFGNYVRTFTFGEEVEVIPDNLCKNMWNLQSAIVIPNSVKHIGAYAFYGISMYSKLMYQDADPSIYLGDSVITIGEHAFDRLDWLTSITIPKTVTNVGAGAFNNCPSLTEVHISDLDAWCGIQFADLQSNPLYYAHNLYLNDSLVTEVVVPDHITALSEYAFEYCDSLHSVTLPAGLNSIGSAFICCYNLNHIECRAVVPPVVDGAYYGVFENVSLHIPCADRAAYEAHPVWGTVANITCMNVDVSVRSNDETRGTVSGEGTFAYESEVTITATAEYGYHFSQWSDGVTVNPRTFVATQDTVLTAYFEKNSYNVSVNAPHGRATGTGSGLYLDTMTIEVSADYGYHFSQWNDGVTVNPRNFVLTQDTVFTAEYGRNSYTVSVEAEHATVTGTGPALYLDTVKLEVIPDYGYRFLWWADEGDWHSEVGGNNPRTIVVTEDVSFEAIMDLNVFPVTFLYESREQGVIENSIGGIYEPNQTSEYPFMEELLLTAVPEPDYEFVSWGDSLTDNPRTFVVTGEMTISVLFAKKGQGIDNPNANAKEAKELRNGHLLILRGEKVFTVIGQEVK